MDNNLPEPEMGLKVIGPFEQNRLCLDGYRVPRLTGKFINDGEIFTMTLDERFGFDVPKELAHGAVWMIANALAIGAGYTCHGERSQRLNPFKLRMIGLDGPDDHAVNFFNDDRIEG